MVENAGGNNTMKNELTKGIKNLVSSKWDNLHAQANKYQNRKQPDRDADAIAYTKEFTEFTFTP